MTDSRWSPPGDPNDIADVHEALHIFQADLPTLKKDRDGQVGNQKTKYADLTQANEVVLTRLNALGCTWVCMPDVIGDNPGRFVLRWELRHVASGTVLTGMFPVLGDSPMKHGAAITYARRYSLLAVTGVIPEDEDDDAQSFEDGHAVARRAPSGRAPAQRRPAAARGEAVAPPARSGRAAPPLPGEEQAIRDEGGRAEQEAMQRAVEPGEHDPGSVSQVQHKKMHALWGELARLGQTQFAGEPGRNERLNATAKMAGLKTLSSSSDLSYVQAAVVVERLRARVDQLKARAAQAGGPS